jgi:hypothetical protein
VALEEPEPDQFVGAVGRTRRQPLGHGDQNRLS